MRQVLGHVRTFRVRLDGPTLTGEGGVKLGMRDRMDTREGDVFVFWGGTGGGRATKVSGMTQFAKQDM